MYLRGDGPRRHDTDLAMTPSDTQCLCACYKLTEKNKCWNDI